MLGKKQLATYKVAEMSELELISTAGGAYLCLRVNVLTGEKGYFITDSADVAAAWGNVWSAMGGGWECDVLMYNPGGYSAC